MAEAYGTLIFSKSEDCKFDMTTLLDLLNEFKWCERDTRWMAGNDGGIYANSECSEFPTTFPKLIESISVENEDGELSILDCNKLDDEISGQYFVEYNYRHPDLDEICSTLGGAIESGWIQIGLSANMGKRYAIYQSLTVYSDAKGVRHCCMTGYAHPDGITTEYTSNFRR